jgi:hypothetical protein
LGKEYGIKCGASKNNLGNTFENIISKMHCEVGENHVAHNGNNKISTILTPSLRRKRTEPLGHHFLPMLMAWA